MTIEQTVGEIKGALDQIASRLESDRHDRMTEHEETNAQISALSKSLADLSKSLAVLAASHEAEVKRLTKVAASVESLMQLRNNVAGGVLALIAVGSGVIAAVGWLLDPVLKRLGIG